MFRTYDEVVANDLIPMIDETYRTYPTAIIAPWRASRWAACSHFSLRSITLISFPTSVVSAAPAAGSAGAPFDPKTAHNGVMADADAFNKKVHLAWLGIGTAEAKAMYDGVKGYHEGLEKAGIKHVYYESPGTAHEWLTWRRCLHEFAPTLFK